MNFKYGVILCAALITSTGCAAFKERTGEYITEAVRDKIKNDVDDVLQRRGLSIAEIGRVADQNGDGGIQPKEVVATVRDLAKDYLSLEGRNMLDSKLAAIEAQRKDLVTKNELDGDLKSKAQESWLWLLGTVGTLVSTYLGKQVVSAKNDGKRDARLALLEKSLQKDLNNDGFIGEAPNPQPEAAA